MEKQFKAGFMVGRFQHIHKGHQEIIERGINSCEKFVVFVGSSQESETRQNPYSAAERIKLIKKIYGDLVEVIPLPDITTPDDISEAWGKYVMEQATMALGEHPDYMVTGSGDSQSLWFTEDQLTFQKGRDMARMYFDIVPRSNTPISATEMRHYLLTDNFQSWKQFADIRIHCKFEWLRLLLLIVEYHNLRRKLIVKDESELDDANF